MLRHVDDAWIRAGFVAVLVLAIAAVALVRIRRSRNGRPSDRERWLSSALASTAPTESRRLVAGIVRARLGPARALPLLGTFAFGLGTIDGIRSTVGSFCRPTGADANSMATILAATYGDAATHIAFGLFVAVVAHTLHAYVLARVARTLDDTVHASTSAKLVGETLARAVATTRPFVALGLASFAFLVIQFLLVTANLNGDVARVMMNVGTCEAADADLAFGRGAAATDLDATIGDARLAAGRRAVVAGEPFDARRAWVEVAVDASDATKLQELVDLSDALHEQHAYPCLRIPSVDPVTAP